MAMSLTTRRTVLSAALVFALVAALYAFVFLRTEEHAPPPRSLVPDGARHQGSAEAADGSVVELWLSGDSTTPHCWHLVDIGPRGERRDGVSACVDKPLTLTVSRVFGGLIGTAGCATETRVRVTPAGGGQSEDSRLYEGHFLISKESLLAKQDSLDVACVSPGEVPAPPVQVWVAK